MPLIPADLYCSRAIAQKLVIHVSIRWKSQYYGQMLNMQTELKIHI